MLEALLGSGIRNAAVVVTRYFGGVLLGTGGLVRAYTRAVQEGLAACTVGRMRYGAELQVLTDYNGVGKVLRQLGSMGLEPASCEYTDKVTLRVVVPAEDEEAVRRNVADATGGRAVMEKLRETYFVEKEE